MTRLWLARINDWAARVRGDVGTLWLAARDPRVPWTVKALSAAVVAYAVSPIDLIPDFIPVLGYLDDVILVPAGIWLALRMIAPPVRTELRAQALTAAAPVTRAGFVLVLGLWALGLAVGWWWWF